MSEPTDLEIVTWALDNGWSRERPMAVLDVYWHDPQGKYYPFTDEALAEMRKQYAAARRPTLAERIAEAVMDAHIGSITPPRMQDVVRTVKRVLDKEGERA